MSKWLQLHLWGFTTGDYDPILLCCHPKNIYLSLFHSIYKICIFSDNSYLDASSNGLTYVAEQLKELLLLGYVTRHQSERSQMAATAAEHL